MGRDPDENALEFNVSFGRRFRDIKRQYCFQFGKKARRGHGPFTILASCINPDSYILAHRYHYGIHLECRYRKYYFTGYRTNGKE